MILVIDTSSTVAVIATIDAEKGSRSQMFIPARDPALLPNLRRMARLSKITKVAFATGPGSFTGLRTGVSFGLGLAIGLRIPIVPLPSLDLQAARSDTAVIAIVEAGRGRVYFLVPGRQPAVGGPQDLPWEHPLVGWVSPSTEAALIETGHRFRPEAGLRDFSVAAEELLKTAREVPYSSLKLEYMQSFSASK